MSSTYLKLFLGRNDVKIVIICTVTGGILQILSKLKKTVDSLDSDSLNLAEGG
jgi:hypothetical protein